MEATQTLPPEHTFVFTSSRELKQAFREIIDELLDEREEQRLQEELELNQTEIPKSEACRRLHRDGSTLYRWEKRGQLHPIKHDDGRVFYKLKEIVRLEAELR